MDTVKHAVLPVAGFGTRMLPLSKSIPKELLPLGAKPVIHHVISEAIAAGIEHLILVGHAQKSALEDYLDINAELDHQLRTKGKVDLADQINFIPEHVSVSSVRQGKALGLGHAVLQAKAIVGNMPFAVLLPDVVMSPFDENLATDNLKVMIDRYEQVQRSQILVEPVDQKDIHKYGIASPLNSDFAVNTHQAIEVQGFVEKPSADDAPSNLAIVGRYIFNAKIFDYLETTKPGAGGEIQLTDAIDALIKTQGVEVLPMSGVSFDAGDMQSYFEAFKVFSEHHLSSLGT